MKRYILFPALILLAYSAGLASAQDQGTGPKNVRQPDKEELYLARDLLTDSSRGDAQEASDKKYFLSMAPAKPKDQVLKSKTVFRPEVGLIDIVSIPPQKDGFYKFSLKDCVDIAVKNSITLQAAQKNISLARMRLFEARRNMLPSVVMALQDYNGAIYGRKYIGRKEYIEGQQPVFHGGELYFTMKQAETNLEIVTNEYAKQKNELVLQVKKAFYTLAKAKENLKMQKDLAAETEKIFDMISRQLEAGVTSKLEFLNVNSQTSQVRYQLASADGDESMAQLMLKQAMNLDLPQKIDIESDLEFRKVSVDFEKALQAAFTMRPDIKINSLMVDYYNYGKRIAQAKGMIKIDIMGNWGLAKEEYVSGDRWNVYPDPNDINDPTRKLEQQWYAGVKASMPFWGSTAEYSWTREQWTPMVSAYQGTEANTNSWKVNILDKLDYYSGKQSALVDFDKARQEFNKIKQDVALEVKENCFNYEKAVLQLDTAANKVKYQESDLELVKLKRSMDEAQDSNVVESMIKLAQEKFGYVQALTDCHISIAGINKAVGVEDYFKNEAVPANKTRGAS